MTHGADAINASLFLSLVMEMAFTLVTRWDLSVYDVDATVDTTKVAVRSTFTSETQGVIATTDPAIVLATNLHEIQYGPLSLSEAARLTEEA